MIVLKPNMFYAPSNYRRDRCNVPAENGDYTIEIPSLEFGEESYASLNIVGRLMQDYEYCLSLYLHDVNDEWQTYDLHGTDICFLLYTILPLLNLALKDGCLISHLNFDWLEWQCNAWEWGEANGQGRGFLFNEDDIYDLESLYRYLKSFKIEAIKQSLYKRGGGVYWTDVCICFRYIDNYISNLISDALGVKFIISGDTAKVVSYKLELDKDECDGYCPNNSSILQNNEAEKYREQIEMKLMIHVLRAFDLIELKKNRLIK